MSSTYDTLILEIQGPIAVVTLNRPEKKNAMNPAMIEDYLDCLTQLWSDETVSVVILTGAGDVFHAGMDLEEYFLANYENPRAMARLRRQLSEAHRLLYRMPKVTLACVNGHAFGNGVLMISMCDLAIAAEEAKLGLSEINFGMLPAGGATWGVANLLPPKDGLYLALTGESITARQAREMHMVNQVVPRDQLWTVTWELAEKLGRKNPTALMEAKKVYWMSRNLSMEESSGELELAKVDALSRVTESEWIRTALAQFKARRYKPGFETYQRPPEQGQNP